MQTLKKSYFTSEQIELAKLAKALGHPARVAILHVLLEQETCVCNEIVEQLPLAQATISQHLKVLKDSGLIQGEIAPNKSCYCINPEGWKTAKRILGIFFEGYHKPQPDLCCD